MARPVVGMWERRVAQVAAGTLVAVVVAGCAASAATGGGGGVVDAARATTRTVTLAADTPSPEPTVTPAPTVAPSASPGPSPTPAPSATPSGSPGSNPEPLVESGPAWTTRSVSLLRRAGDDRTAAAHVGPAFPVTLTSRSALLGGTRWAEARWHTPSRAGTAWIPLASLTRSRPTRTPTASIDALDVGLSRYLDGLGTRAGVYVWDLGRGMVYGRNASRPYLVASSIKVEIMCWFLSTLEAEGREPTRRERDLLTAMIVRSDNDAAYYFYDLLGDAPGMTAYMRRIGVAGLLASPQWRGWGWSTVTPTAQATVLRLLQQGRLLSPAHTAYALGLLRSVIPEHRIGVGTTAPAGADVAMKVGWVVGPDGMWVMNSSGIVTYGGITYVIAVYTDRDATLEEGWAIVERVAGDIADALLPDD